MSGAAWDQSRERCRFSSQASDEPRKPAGPAEQLAGLFLPDVFAFVADGVPTAMAQIKVAQQRGGIGAQGGRRGFED